MKSNLYIIITVISSTSEEKGCLVTLFPKVVHQNKKLAGKKERKTKIGSKKHYGYKTTYNINKDQNRCQYEDTPNNETMSYAKSQKR